MLWGLHLKSVVVTAFEHYQVLALLCLNVPLPLDLTAEKCISTRSHHSIDTNGLHTCISDFDIHAVDKAYHTAPNIEQRKMTLDDVLDKIGDFGRYQKRNYALLIGAWILTAPSMMMSVFVMGVPKHRYLSF